jgi:outer membrane receptor protein involved in Fe transport
MNSNSKLSYAIAAILSGTPLGLSFAATATDSATNDSDSIQEITVTAQRRNESIQDVPITIQAITGDTLKQLNVSTFDDLLRYTPNVTFSGNGPGTGNIFMRGLSSGGSGNQSQSTTAPFPNVALYLDDQSMQFPARNNDVYMVDMERVEVLEGPQGTLFGGGSQAGAIRYITNKPKLDVTEGDVNAGYGITAGGDPNNNLNATLNLPLIADTLAVRATIFSDHRGGYISNVPGTISFTSYPTAAALKAYPGTPPTNSLIANNSAEAGSNLNTATYGGGRLSALYKINDDWNILLQQNYQQFEADGYFASEPVAPDGQVLGKNQVEAFAPAYDKDRYESTAWTLNGKVTDLVKAVYTGSYMVRHIEQQQDYSNYLRSAHGSYYDCSGRGAGYSYFRSAKPTTCYAPVGTWVDTVRNTHQTHELRFTSSEDLPVRGVLGAYWEKFVIDDDMNFNYLTIPQCSPANLAVSAAGGPDCVAAVGPIPGYYATDPSTRLNSNTAFGEDVQRGYVQKAFFGSFDFDLIPKVLTFTAGTRHFTYDEFEHGSEYYSATSSILNVPNGSNKYDGFGINLKKSESGFKSRGNLTWHITPDILAYYTWSQGFRPGGFNRTSTSIDGSTISLKAVAPITPGGPDQYLKPAGYSSDNLVNNELGLKSEFWDHKAQVNLSLYQMDWKDVQLPLFDPTHLGNTTFDVNGPSYRVKGVELQVVTRPLEGLTIQGSSSWNSSDQTDAPCLASSGVTSNKHTKGNPTPAGDCITEINGQPYTNPYGVLGTSPAYSPPLQFNLRARYDWVFGDYKPFVSVGGNHIATMRNEPASFPDGNGPLCNPVPTTTLCKYTMPGYTTYDGALGVAKDSWTAQLTAVNLTNSDASTNTSSGQFIRTEVPLRPRVLTVQFGYKF